MKAALVTAFDTPPCWSDVQEPVAAEPHEMVVEVVAAGLHPRVRSQADGSHYTSTDELPLVPGIDGVGRGPDGVLRYFVLGDTRLGSMAERTVIDVRRSVALPEDADPIAVAAAANPVMSSWIALRQRTTMPVPASVLVLGATGNAGRMAVQVARHLGATHVVAAGRDPARLATLPALGADDVVTLGTADTDAELATHASAVDMVLDYVWGEPTAAAMAALVTARPDRGVPLTWIQIGSVAGTTAPIPSAALRAARLNLIGSGQGSVPTRDIVAELPALAAAISAGTFTVDIDAVPLGQVEQAWASEGSRRVVLMP